jgi:hypothetical protein
MPLEQRSPTRLLIARATRSSKHSERYVLVERGLALCDDGIRESPLLLQRRAVV